MNNFLNNMIEIQVLTPVVFLLVIINIGTMFSAGVDNIHHFRLQVIVSRVGHREPKQL